MRVEEVYLLVRRLLAVTVFVDGRVVGNAEPKTGFLDFHFPSL
jgi:hypothetical protein